MVDLGSPRFRQISDLTEDFVLQKMAYAYKHGYVELMDQVAPESLKQTFKDALRTMGIGILYIAWVSELRAHCS